MMFTVVVLSRQKVEYVMYSFPPTSRPPTATSSDPFKIDKLSIIRRLYSFLVSLNQILLPK